MPPTRTTKTEAGLQESASSRDPQFQAKLNRTSAVATIAGAATAVPPHLLTREVVKQCIGDVFSLDGMRLEAIRNVIDNSHIDQRHSVFPVEYVIEPRPLAQINVEYKQKAVELGMEATASALARAEMSPSDVDLLITVSCTGVMIPSLDAYIATEMGFRSDVRRLPITELGCAAGAAGLGRAWEYMNAFPDRTALLVAVELPTLTFQRKDFSQANLISAVLFGDGAAGVVVTGREAPGPRIIASECFLFPNSLDAMGFDLRDSGFHIVLSKDVPQLIREKVRGLADGFLARQGLTRHDISAFLLHPGGQKLLSFMEAELDLTSADTEISWDVLRRFGNLSSASVLFILQETMTRREMPPESYGLLMAFGPGFTAEMILLQWP
ncbi:MAG: 3-oxoacyl-[acyl-carrier-protein] synthase III C-terminal domain-containing protein [Candidatus Acidiferrales bacterium]